MKIITRLPTDNGDKPDATRRAPDKPRQTILVGTDAIDFRKHQPVLRCWLTSPATSKPPERASLPAILDTGFSGSFCVSEKLFSTWFDLTPNDLKTERRTYSEPGNNRGGYDTCTLKIWLRKNRPGCWWDHHDDGEFIPFTLKKVIVCKPGSAYFKDKPYFGMRAIHDLGLHVYFDGKTRCVSIRDKKRFFGVF